MIPRAVQPVREATREDVIAMLLAGGWVDSAKEKGSVFRRDTRTAFVYETEVLFADDQVDAGTPTGYVDFGRAVALLQAN